MLIGFVLLVVLGFGLPYLYAVYVTYKKTKSDEPKDGEQQQSGII